MADRRDARLHIRPCAAADLEAWAALRAALWPDHGCEALRAEAAACLAEPHRCGQFLAIDAGGVPRGFAEVSMRVDPVNGARRSPTGFLEGLYVAPALRGSGAARALVDAAADWVRRQGGDELASDVDADNGISQQVHQALGFVETERVVFYRKDLA